MKHLHKELCMKSFVQGQHHKTNLLSINGTQNVSSKEQFFNDRTGHQMEVRNLA